jgi:hypothetical protein
VGKIGEPDMNDYCGDSVLINNVRVTGPLNICTERVEVCAGRPFSFEFSFTKSVCPSGTEIFLSNSQGEFGDGQLSLGRFNSGGIQPGQLLTFSHPILGIPITADSSDCYRIRLIWRHPYIGSIRCTSTVSACFKVSKCTQQIQTVQIPMASNVAPPERDTLCAGSIVTVPFWNPRLNTCTEDSDFNLSSVYVAELYRKELATDPDPELGRGEYLLGISNDSRLFRGRCAPQGPGIVGGIVPDEIEEGCNWYARVSATDPEVAGKPWGPFCIKHCHIETNQKQNFNVCVNECQHGEDTVRYRLGAYAASLPRIAYGETNRFIFEMYQIPDPCYREWSKVGTDEKMAQLVGSSIPPNDSILMLKLPPLFGYPANKNPNPSPENPDSCIGPFSPPSVTDLMERPSGQYFMRIMATNPIYEDAQTGDILRLGAGERYGTIVNMSFGAPFVNCHAFIVNNALKPQKPCAGEVVEFEIGIKRFLAAKQSNYDIYWMDDLSIVDASNGSIKRPQEQTEAAFRSYQARLDRYVDSLRLTLDGVWKNEYFSFEPLGLALSRFRWGPMINGRFSQAINAPNPLPALGPVAGTSGEFGLPIRIDQQLERIVQPDSSVDTMLVTRYPRFTYLIVREENGGCFSNASIIRFPVSGPPEFSMTDTAQYTNDTISRSMTFRPETVYTWEVAQMDVVPPINLSIDSIDYAALAQADSVDFSALSTNEQALLLTSKYNYPVRALNLRIRSILDQKDTSILSVGNNRARLKRPGKGIFQMKARGLNRCGIVVDSCFVVVTEEDTTNTSRRNSGGFSEGIYYYPNPVESELNLVFKRPISGYVELQDLSARTIHRQQISSNRMVLDVRSLQMAPGVYLLVVESSGQRETAKIVVK